MAHLLWHKNSMHKYQYNKWVFLSLKEYTTMAFDTSIITDEGLIVLSKLSGTRSLVLKNIYIGDEVFTINDLNTQTPVWWAQKQNEMGMGAHKIATKFVSASYSADSNARIVVNLTNVYGSAVNVKTVVITACTSDSGIEDEEVVFAGVIDEEGITIPYNDKVDVTSSISFKFAINSASSISIDGTEANYVIQPELDRFISCHTLSNPTIGDNQIIYGDKSFLNSQTKFSSSNSYAPITVCKQNTNEPQYHFATPPNGSCTIWVEDARANVFEIYDSYGGDAVIHCERYDTPTTDYKAVCDAFESYITRTNTIGTRTANAIAITSAITSSSQIMLSNASTEIALTPDNITLTPDTSANAYGIITTSTSRNGYGTELVLTSLDAASLASKSLKLDTANLSTDANLKVSGSITCGRDIVCNGGSISIYEGSSVGTINGIIPTPGANSDYPVGSMILGIVANTAGGYNAGQVISGSEIVAAELGFVAGNPVYCAIDEDKTLPANTQWCLLTRTGAITNTNYIVLAIRIS